MTELNELIEWLEDRIETIDTDFPFAPDEYTLGRMGELKFILRHARQIKSERDL